MGCPHPLGVERIKRADGTPGVRCPVCGSVAFKGDSFWTSIKRALGYFARGYPGPPR